jgi:DNA-directed RNA polymerase subunit RPC12/RpoP
MKYISEDALSEILSNFDGDVFTLLSAMINKQKDGVVFFNEDQIAFLKTHSWQWVEVGGGYGFGLYVCGNCQKRPNDILTTSKDQGSLPCYCPHCGALMIKEDLHE